MKGQSVKRLRPKTGLGAEVDAPVGGGYRDRGDSHLQRQCHPETVKLEGKKRGSKPEQGERIPSHTCLRLKNQAWNSAASLWKLLGLLL